MVYIFTEPKVTMDVDMIAERIMQMIGFLFLNRINNTSKQNNVCIAHIAWYVRIFQQFNSNAIHIAYRIFCWVCSLTIDLIGCITLFLKWGFPFEDRLYYHFFLFLSYTIVRKISWLMQYNKVGDTMVRQFGAVDLVRWNS